MDFLPGEATGSQTLLRMESMARQSPFASDVMKKAQNREFKLAEDALDRVVSNISPQQLGVAGTGSRIKLVFDNAVDKAFDTRRTIAGGAFQVIDDATKSKKLIETPNALQAIDEIIRDNDVPGGGDATAKLVNQLKGMRNEFSDQAQLGGVDASKKSANEMQRLLQIWGKGASGRSRPLEDIDAGQQRMISSKLFGALNRDLDETAAFAGLSPDGDVAQAIRTAREQWKTYSQDINRLNESTLGRMFGTTERTPEYIANSISKMEPSVIKETFDLLKTLDPEISSQTKRMMIEQAAEQAGKITSRAAPRRQVQSTDIAEEFSPDKMLTSLQKSNVWEVLEPTEKQQMLHIFRGMERLQKQGGGSQTAPLQQAWSVVKSIMTGGIGAAGDLATAGGVNRFAKTISDPVKRKALMTLTGPSPTVREISSAMSILGLEAPQEQP
jgi:hypothetical protein